MVSQEATESWQVFIFSLTALLWCMILIQQVKSSQLSLESTEWRWASALTQEAFTIKAGSSGTAGAEADDDDDDDEEANELLRWASTNLNVYDQ